MLVDPVFRIWPQVLIHITPYVVWIHLNLCAHLDFCKEFLYQVEEWRVRWKEKSSSQHLKMFRITSLLPPFPHLAQSCVMSGVVCKCTSSRLNICQMYCKYTEFWCWLSLIENFERHGHRMRFVSKKHFPRFSTYWFMLCRLWEEF